MPAPLESLFQLSARDVVSAQWGIIHDFKFLLEPLTTVVAPLYTPPPDQIAFLTHIAMSTGADAGESSTSFLLELLNSAGNIINQVFGDTFLGAVATEEYRTLPGIDLALVGGRHTLKFSATFTGGGILGNTVRLSVGGYAVPKGNAALF